MKIIHASDLHLGPNELEHVDEKTHLRREREERLNASHAFWRSLLEPASKPDALVISGDITIKMDAAGFAVFREQMKTLRNTHALRGKRIVVVPGNHDVAWDVEARLSENERYREFVQAAEDAVRPWIDGVDGELGGLVERRIPYEPYFLDRENGVLIYALNSTLLSGRRATLSDSQNTTLKSLEEVLPAESKPLLSKLVVQMTLHDAAYVGPKQLQLLSWSMKALQEEMGLAEYSRLTKFAVMHHHLAQIAPAPLEMKTFELVLDGAQVAERLADLGFDIMLHGHKHVWHISDSEPGYSRRLRTLSSGTIGGHPAIGSPVGYNVIELGKRDALGWRNMVVRRMLVDATGARLARDGQSSEYASFMVGGRTPTAGSTARTTVVTLRDAIERGVQICTQHGANDAALKPITVLESILREAGCGELLIGTIDEHSEILARTLGNLRTRYIGQFPNYIDRIRDLVSSAQKEVRIACDVPGYGFFSNRPEFQKYWSAISDRLANRTTVRAIFLNGEMRKRMHQRQFGDWKALQKDAKFKMRLELFEHLSQQDIKNSASLQRAFLRQHENLLAEIPSAEILEIDQSMPILVWIADMDERAIFAIPDLQLERLTEHAFETESKSLISALHSIVNHYERGAASQNDGSPGGGSSPDRSKRSGGKRRRVSEG